MRNMILNRCIFGDIYTRRFAFRLKSLYNDLNPFLESVYYSDHFDKHSDNTLTILTTGLTILTNTDNAH